MPDVELQLREYFDASVERITAEDVIAGRAVTDQVRHEATRRKLAPAWAAAYAFALTLLVLGGSLGLGLLLRQEPGFSFGSGGISFEIGTNTTDFVGWALVGLAAVLGIVALMLIVVALRTGTRMRRKEETMATTLERPGIERELESAHRANRWLIAAVVVLAIAVVALGAWVVYDLTTSDTASDLPTDVEALFDDYTAAWNARDGEALLATVDEASYQHVALGSGYDAEATASLVDRSAMTVDVLDLSAVAAGDRYWVVSHERLTTVNDEAEGFSILIVREFPEGWRVLYHEYFGTAPTGL